MLEDGLDRRRVKGTIISRAKFCPGLASAALASLAASIFSPPPEKPDHSREA